MSHSFRSTCAIGSSTRIPGARVLQVVVAFFMLLIDVRTDAGVAPMKEEVEPTPVSLADLLELRTIREVAIDPDGRFAVISIESFEREAGAEAPLSFGDYGIRRHLHRVDLIDPATPARQLTFGDRRDSSPRISPDGRMLAFVRSGEKGDDGQKGDEEDPSRKSQVWTMPLEGGGEASPVTRFEHGASRPRWSPDGARLVVETRFDLDGLVKEDGPPSWPVSRPGRAAHPLPVEHEDPGFADPGGTPEQIAATGSSRLS